MNRTLPILAVLVACCVAPAAQVKRAPNLELKDLAGNAHHIADLRGSIAVFNFWATWCGPCREELPMLTQLGKEYAPNHVRFIAASADESTNLAKVSEFVKSHNLGMDVWVGADLDMLERADLGNELPATLILDQDGNVITRIKGEAREVDLRDALDWLVNGKQGPPPPRVITHY